MSVSVFVFCFLSFIAAAKDPAGYLCPCGYVVLPCGCGCREGTYQGPQDRLKCCVACPIESSNCFPGDVTVRLDTGQSVRMKDLVGGQRVLSVQNGKRVFSEVRTFLHRKPGLNMTYLTLVTLQGRQLTVSELHVVFTSRCNTSASMKPTFAKSVKPGDYLFTESCSNDLCPEQVEQIFLTKKQGLYAPLTDTGTVVVNGILASCFGNALNQDFVQRFTMSPFRWFPWLLEPWQEDGFSPILSNLEKLYGNLVSHISWLT